MSIITFAQFLQQPSPLVEDASAEVQRLQAELSNITAQLQQRTAPLERRKQQITLLLARAQEKLQAEQKSKEKSGMDQTAPTQGTANQTTTPGSSGSATPGSTSTVR